LLLASESRSSLLCLFVCLFVLELLPDGQFIFQIVDYPSQRILFSTTSEVHITVIPTDIFFFFFCIILSESC